MNKRIWGIFILLSAVWLVWAASIMAQDDGEDPVNVGLRYFTVTAQADGVHLDWATETELDTAGFVIDRSLGTSTDFVRLDNIGFVNGLGGVATGATYSEVDDTAVIGQTYTYKLVEIETDSSEHGLETVTITFIITPTATSIVVGGSNPTATSTQSSPPTPTRTPTTTPTSTTAANNDSSAQATATSTADAASALSAGVPTQTATAPPAATTANTVGSPTPSPLASPTPNLVIDRAFDNNNDAVVLAQEEPTVYPEPDATQDDPVNEFYPPGQEPEVVPANPSPYPEGFQPAVQPTVAVIGSDVTRAAEGGDLNLPAPSATILRGRILLWTGFLISFFIFLSGIIGAIVLYRRRPS